ncbi:MAG: hemolysin family protein, partial [Planctomycetota bacterium]
LLFILLCCSAFFSGSETAFFSLSRKRINDFEKSDHKLSHLVSSLLNNPFNLLGCFLFGNMLVNVLYYATASVLIIRIEQQVNIAMATITAFISFFALILFGEVFPKSLAFANSKAVTLFTVLPTYFITKILVPFIFVFRYIIIEPTLRLLQVQDKQQKAMSTQEFKMLIEASRRGDLISPDENKLLTEIANLGFLKVRHVMQPRVDMISCKTNDSVQKTREMMIQKSLTKLPVYHKNIDNIVGFVLLRDLFLYSEKSLGELTQNAFFVPEQKSAESLLNFFQKTQSDTAVVVDEYGGIAGLVRLEDIAEELLGPVEFVDQIEPIEKIGPFEFRLSGNLSIHEWAEAFGIKIDETRLSTIGGMVTALLGKIPENGDATFFKNIKLTVEKVNKGRIETIILSFEPFTENDL